MRSFLVQNLLIILTSIFASFGFRCQAKETILKTKDLLITLSINKKGVPYIQKVQTPDQSVVYFIDSSFGDALQNRLVNKLFTKEASIKPLSGWTVTEDNIFIKASASVKVNDVSFTVQVDLMKDRSFFLVYNKVSADKPAEISEFPIYASSLHINEKEKSIKWWKALNYTPQQEPISSDTHLSFYSRIHSSDNFDNAEGNVPYWTIQTPRSFMGFSLAWSGGWRASFNSVTGDRLTADVYLPEEETQLKLAAGESVKGPELAVFCSTVSDPVTARKNWLDTRSSLAARLYPVPQMGIPFIYNHWYSVGSNLSEQFISHQLQWFDEFGFDVFMVDDGWYKNPGSWTPSGSKFKPGGFEKSLATIRSQGAISGLWTCPQLFSVQKPFPGFIDQPGHYVPGGLNAWLVDYTAVDFNKSMIRHLDTLKSTGAGWWKFDQDFFAAKPRAGKLRSVNAFQEGFAAARKEHPDMIFEACMSGGKMINEFTDRIAQIHWIRDGNRTGYVHALTNIHEALGAIDFLEPQKVERWTNRINETEMKSPDLLKFYSRSCMIGSWGISADLNKISEQQRNIIVAEVKNYRRLNEIKKDHLIEYKYPAEYVSLVPVVYYNSSYTKAAVLLYSLTPNEKQVKFKLKTRLDAEKTYSFSNVDVDSNSVVNGNTFELTLVPGQNSAIFFIDRVE